MRLPKPLEAAVEMVAAVIVEGDLIGLAVDGEAAPADAVGRAAGDGAAVGRMIDVIGEAVEAEDERMVDAGEAHVADDGAPGDDGGGEIAGGDA